MKQAVCPKCFARHSAGESVYICMSPACETLGKSQPCRESGKGLPFSLFGKPQACDGCGQPLSVKICPACGYRLDSVQSGTGSISISLVGAEGCGKSNYLSVLVEQLKKQVTHTYDCSLYPLGGDDTIKAYDTQYYKPVFVDSQCVPKTAQADILPLVYSLVFSSSSRYGKTCNIILYDSCGASYQSVQSMTADTPNIDSSKGIVLLIDPTTLPQFSQQDTAKIAEPDPNTLLSRTINLLRSSGGRGNVGKKIDVPLAVCITKLDSIWSTLDQSSFLRQPSRHLDKPCFDNIDFNCCNLEAQSLLETFVGKDFINQVKSQFQSYGFFGVTSLGCTPNANGRITRISPHRVCDPLLWILLQNKIIKDSQ